MRFDNDLLKPGERDRDYTFGASFTRVADDAVEGPQWLADALDWTDGVLGVPRAAAGDGRAFEIGVQIFTPDDLTAEEPLPDDRPYANLVYAASSRLAQDAAHRAVYQSTLTLGVLGLPVVGNVQRAAHDLLGNPRPGGYDHQISDGGEPTFRYAFSKHRLLASRGGGGNERTHSWRFGFGASVGYITEASVELAFRSGPERVAWWSAPPLSSDYAGQPPIESRKDGATAATRGLVVEGGVTIRARAYNAFLQGQVRHSDVTFASDELNHVLAEAWLAFSIAQKNGINVSYTLRWQSPEISDGTGSRSFSWGSLSFARRF